METREPKFTYIRNEKGFPVACLAYTREDGLFKYAVSVHNPKDKFDREMARKVAGGRLLKNESSSCMGIPLEDEFKDWSTKDCIQFVMEQFADEDYMFPTRLQKAAKQYLEYSGKFGYEY